MVYESSRENTYLSHANYKYIDKVPNGKGGFRYIYDKPDKRPLERQGEAAANLTSTVKKKLKKTFSLNNIKDYASKSGTLQGDAVARVIDSYQKISRKSRNKRIADAKKASSTPNYDENNLGDVWREAQDKLNNMSPEERKEYDERHKRMEEAGVLEPVRETTVATVNKPKASSKPKNTVKAEDVIGAVQSAKKKYNDRKVHRLNERESNSSSTKARALKEYDRQQAELDEFSKMVDDDYRQEAGRERRKKARDAMRRKQRRAHAREDTKKKQRDHIEHSEFHKYIEKRPNGRGGWTYIYGKDYYGRYNKDKIAWKEDYQRGIEERTNSIDDFDEQMARRLNPRFGDQRKDIKKRLANQNRFERSYDDQVYKNGSVPKSSSTAGKRFHEDTIDHIYNVEKAKEIGEKTSSKIKKKTRKLRKKVKSGVRSAKYKAKQAGRKVSTAAGDFIAKLKR